MKTNQAIINQKLFKYKINIFFLKIIIILNFIKIFWNNKVKFNYTIIGKKNWQLIKITRRIQILFNIIIIITVLIIIAIYLNRLNIYMLLFINEILIQISYLKNVLFKIII